MRFCDVPKHPTTAYRKRMETIREPSLVGKMISALRHHKPAKGYDLYAIERFDVPDADLIFIEHTRTKKAALAVQATLAQNSVLLGAHDRNVLKAA